MTFPFARTDWHHRIRNGLSLLPEKLPVNTAERARAVGIFNRLRLPDVPGTPPFAEAAGEWFREIVGALLGSVDPVTTVRMIRELFVLTPKKNSKTTNGAGLMVTALLMNKRPRAEFLFVGPTNLISDLAFDQAVGMIETDPEGFLQKRMHITGHQKTITDRRTKAELKIKTFDKSVLTGIKPAGVLLDELHEIAKNAQASKIIGQIRGGLLPIPEAFLAFITTQSDEPPAGAFKAELNMARAIRDGRVHGPMLPVLYEFPPDIMRDPAKWMDPANWPMVTPNKGRSITIDRLLPDFETAKIKGEDELRRWASQHLNIEIGVALMTERWEGADFWEQQADEDLTLDEVLKRSEVCVIGIDGGGLDDLLSFCVVGRDSDKQWLAWHHTWMHRKVLELRKNEAERFADFKTAGDLTIVDDLTEAYAALATFAKRVDESELLHQIGLDPMGVGLIVDALAEVGIENVEGEDERVVGVSQGWKLNGAIKTAAVKLASGELHHAGQKITAWAVGNAKAEPKGNAVTITKQAAGAGKIDPLMALFDAVALMSMNPPARTSVYEQEDLLVL